MIPLAELRKVLRGGEFIHGRGIGNLFGFDRFVQFVVAEEFLVGLLHPDGFVHWLHVVLEQTLVLHARVWYRSA